MSPNDALYYEERWPALWIVLGACGYLLFLGVMWGTSIRHEMPRFLLWFATLFLVAKGTFILSHQRTVVVDLESGKVTTSRRCFGVHLMPQTHDLRAVQSVFLERSDTSYLEDSKPVSQRRAGNIRVTWYVHLVTTDRDKPLLTVFGGKSAEPAAERAALWSRALGVLRVDHLPAEVAAGTR